MKQKEPNKRINLAQLRVDLTHRCNLKCEFCYNGEAENVDINEAIIDKTLNEIKGFYIHTFVLAGGETFLTPDMFQYVVDKLIKKHILIGSFGAYTNGTILNSKIRDAFDRITKYLNDIENEIKPFKRLYENETDFLYGRAKSYLVISVNGHNTNNNQIKRAKEFYALDTKGFAVVTDSNNSKGLIIGGNVFKNHKSIIPKEISINTYSIADSFEYNIIKEFNYSDNTKNDLCDILIRESLNIAADGSVYIGNAVSFENVHIYSPFNIMECVNNFIEKLDYFCWLHPINFKILNTRNKDRLIKWCDENGHIVKEKNNELMQLLNAALIFADRHEATATQVHMKYPFLNHTEVDYVTSMCVALNQLKYGVDILYVKTLLFLCSDFEQDVIDSFTPIFAKRTISGIISNAKSRG